MSFYLVLQMIVVDIVETVQTAYIFSLIFALAAVLCLKAAGGRKIPAYRFFLLAFYTAMILSRTLVHREPWPDPLSNVLGGWTFTSEKGKFTVESVENVLMFIPFVPLFFWNFGERFQGGGYSLPMVLRQSTLIVLWFSLLIETTQLVLSRGTFQLSDLFYNTAGGFLGGLVWYPILRTCSGRLFQKEEDYPYGMSARAARRPMDSQRDLLYFSENKGKRNQKRSQNPGMESKKCE